MKYRIRNVMTGTIIFSDKLVLMYNGDIINIGRGIKYDHLKPEFEVADGVYEGDYLLIYTDTNPLIARVVIREGLPALNGFSSHFVPIYLPINLILTNDYEVI